MNHTTPDTIQFKFLWHNGLGKKNQIRTGSFDGHTIRLGEFTVVVANIIDFSTHEQNFFFEQFVKQGSPQSIHIEVFDTDVAKLQKAIDASHSAAVAHQERERLSIAGELNSYRDAICPFCDSTIVLSGLPETDQVFCEFCDTLFSVQREEFNNDERYFRICEGCGMYSRPRQFAVFYFYFLVFTFGFHHDTTIRCSGCMRSSAWKMVFGNLFGLLGFPFALMQLYRSYATSKLTGRFEGLDDANVLSRRRKIDQALDKYDEIMDKVPDNAGVKFNIGFGLFLKKDYEHAQQMFEMSLDDCANYWPSLNGLIRVLKLQNKTKELEAVEKLWGFDGRQSPID